VTVEIGTIEVVEAGRRSQRERQPVGPPLTLEDYLRARSGR
jgi:hypothetical protein